VALTFTNPFNAGADECERDGDNVDGQLKLEELGDTVVHVPTPDHRLHDARKVVVEQYDVRRFLRNVRPALALHCIATDATKMTTNMAYFIVLPPLQNCLTLNDTSYFSYFHFPVLSPEQLVVLAIVFSVRCNIYISRLCYDVSVRLSVCDGSAMAHYS